MLPGRKFLPAPLAFSDGPYLIDPCKRDEIQKISGLYHSLELQQLRPKGYEKCMKLPYDFYSPSTEANNADYVCPYILCKKICTTKELLSYHLKATQHHAYEETDMISIEDDMHEDEEETLDIIDGPCLIPGAEKYLEQPFETILQVTFFYKCDILVDVPRYYGFCYFILKTLQAYHNFWYHYCS